MTALDPGVANERTSMSWQRTALAGLAGAAIITRLTWDAVGVFSLAPLAFSSVTAGWIFREGALRYLHAGTTRRRDGLMPLLVAAVVTSACLVQVASVFASG